MNPQKFLQKWLLSWNTTPAGPAFRLSCERQTFTGARRTFYGSGAPQNWASFTIAAPTRLSGVDAPEVRPIATGPSGSHSVAVTSVFDPIGRCRMEAADSRQSGSAM